MMNGSAGRLVGLLGTGFVLGVILGGTSTSGKESSNAVASRVQKTEDRQAIEQLMMGDYPRALDSSNWKTYWQTVATRNGTTTILGAGHYEDTLKKENGAWKFARRAIVTDPPPAAQTTASATPQ